MVVKSNKHHHHDESKSEQIERRIEVLSNWLNTNEGHPSSTVDDEKSKSFDSNSVECCANPNVLRKLDAVTLDRVQDTYTTYYKQLERESNAKQSTIRKKYHDARTIQLMKRILVILRRYIIPVVCGGLACVPLWYLLTNRQLRRRIMHMSRIRKQHHFNLLEMLISISILLTFSSLTSALYYKKLHSSRVQFTKIQLNLINQALLLYVAETGDHPLELPDSLDVETKDAWGNDFIFVPYLDLDQKNQQQGHIEKIIDIVSNYGHAPEILYFASKGEFCFAEGIKGVIFAEDVTDENKRYIVSVIQRMREGNRLRSLLQIEGA